MTKQNKKIAVSVIGAILLTMGGWLVVGIGYLIKEAFGFEWMLGVGLTVLSLAWGFSCLMSEADEKDKRGELDS